MESDPLASALRLLRPRGVFLFRSELAAPWGLTDGPGPATFHIVESGQCLLTVEDETVTLEAGDLAVLPRGSRAAFRDAPGRPAPPVADLLDRYPPDAGVVRKPGTGPTTMLVCGGVAFDDAVPHPILEVLPPLLLLRAAMQDSTPWLADTIRIFACESRSGRPGATTIMGHLGSVLFVQAVRAALSDGASPGWLVALNDVHLAPVLQAIHESPEQSWTVETLGQKAGLGRSAFAARFRDAVGEPPMQHVARWRMYRAAQLLQHNIPLAEVADRVGYENTSAFSRAFSRWTGRPPSTVGLPDSVPSPA